MEREAFAHYELLYPPAPHWRHSLYPYQVEWVLAAERAIADSRALRSSAAIQMLLRISRQGGKNEVAARLQARLLWKYRRAGGSIVVTAPTAEPQLIISKRRLTKALAPLAMPVRERRVRAPQQRLWDEAEGYIFSLGRSELCLLSGDPAANRVGHSASLAMFVDETQHYSPEVFSEVMQPMLATGCAATLFMGTCWTNESFIQRKAEELARQTDRRLVFEYPWWVVARYNPAYHRFVLGVQEELGASHPIFLSQYCLIPIDRLGRLFAAEDLARMRGAHPRESRPRPGAVYVAGVDLAGADEQDPAALLVPGGAAKRDATVATVARLMWRKRGEGQPPLPVLRVVDHLYRPGMHPERTVDELHDYLFRRWRCVAVAVDGGGVGDAVAATLQHRRPDQVRVVKPSVPANDRMCNRLMGTAKTGRLTMYRADEESAVQAEEFWFQVGLCLREVLPSGKMRFHAPETRRAIGTGTTRPVHDDFPKSLGFLVEAADEHLYMRTEHIEEEESPYQWGRGYA